MKRRLTTCWGLAIAAVAIPLLAAGYVHGAGLLIADGGFGGVLEIKDHDVKVTINNGVAVTHGSSRVFRNTEDRIVEALVHVPRAEGSRCANFSMWINGKEMIGEVVEKQRARADLRELQTETHATLDCWSRSTTRRFEMRIFPIAARCRAARANHVLPGTGLRSRLGDLRLPARHDIAKAGGGQLVRKLLVVGGRKERSAHCRDEESIAREDVAISAFGSKLYRASLEATPANWMMTWWLPFGPTSDHRAGHHYKQDAERGRLFANDTDGRGRARPGGRRAWTMCSCSMFRAAWTTTASSSCLIRAVDFLVCSEPGPEDRFEIITFNDLPAMNFRQLTHATAETHAEPAHPGVTAGSRWNIATSGHQSAYRYADHRPAAERGRAVRWNDGSQGPGPSGRS